MSQKHKLIYIFSLLIFGSVCFFAGRNFKSTSSFILKGFTNQYDVTDNIRSSGYKYINPLLDCAQNEADFSQMTSFKDDVDALVTKEKTNGNADFISLYYRDMNNGPTMSINSDATFAPASLLKVPLMMAYYKLSETKPEIFNDQITVTSLAPLVPNQQYIKPENLLTIGKTYSVAELIDHMIRYSDNNAAQLLITHMDLPTLINVYKDFNLNLPTDTQPETYVTVKQYANFFNLLFNGSYLSKSDSEKSIETMLNIDYKDGLVAGVPGNVDVSHKFGERVIDGELTQLHDCGIVYYPKRPYLLCVMTRGNDEQKLSKAIGEISSLVYKEVDNQISN